LLKVEPVSKAAELEYYDGKTLKGAITLQGATVSPGAGGSFALHGLDRTWYMRPVDTDMTESLAWITAIKCGIERRWDRRPSGHQIVPGTRAVAGTPQKRRKNDNDNGVDESAGGVVYAVAPTAVVPPRIGDAGAAAYPGTNITRLDVPEDVVDWGVEHEGCVQLPTSISWKCKHCLGF
jgi:hypothetical protein